jgi:hypothetical protein
MRAAGLWDEVLDAAGAPPALARSNNRDLDSTASMERQFCRAGLRPVRSWTEAIDHTFRRDDFWALRAGFGNTRWRLAQLDPAARREVTTVLRARFATLELDDLRFRGRVVLAIAEEPD